MQFLFQKYKIEEDVKPKLNDFFKPLFDLISNYSERIVVGTTNYDLAIETYCNLTGSDYQCVDGFHMSGNSHIWNPNYLNENFDRPGERFVYLHKIHGSLNWTGKSPDLIKYDQIPNFEPESSVKPSTIIAPTLSPKNAYSEPPFQFLLENFSKHLLESDICIVIGFSFRDNYITEHFKEFIDNRKHLIIVSPNCYRDYAENIFNLQNDYSDEGIKEWSTSHARGAVNRHVSFIDLPFDGENNNKTFEKIKNMLK